MSSAPSPLAPQSSPRPSEAVCAVHPGRSARTTCERCGNFVCQECGAKGGLCPPCRARTSDSPYAACPQCGERSAKALSFTWWGGAVGPKLLTHVKCADCSATYNGKTGRSNNKAIAVYFVIVNAIALALVFALYS